MFTQPRNYSVLSHFEHRKKYSADALLIEAHNLGFCPWFKPNLDIESYL